MSTLPNIPAHPQINLDGYASGLAIREYFSACAMQGLLSFQGERITEKFVADSAVRYADALIKELNKHQP